MDVPLNVLGPSGSYVRTDNTTGLAYVGSGNGSTAPEQYVAYHGPDTSNMTPVQPGQTTYLQSEQTGMWCRLVPSPSNSTQIGMVCDQPTSATAVLFTYTGDGLAVDGVQLVAGGTGQPLLLANTTTTPVTSGTADNLTFVPVANPAGEWLAAGCGVKMQNAPNWLSASQPACLLARLLACVPACPPACFLANIAACRLPVFPTSQAPTQPCCDIADCVTDALMPLPLATCAVSC